MADLINLDTESDRIIIGDDSSATLTLQNTSSGNVIKLQNASGTGVPLSVVSSPTVSIMATGRGSAAVLRSSATTSVVLDVAHSVAISSPTVAPIRVLTSSASGPYIEFVGRGAVSTASGGPTVAFGIRVKYGNEYGWIRAYTDIHV